jgi:hypothetical protein
MAFRNDPSRTCADLERVLEQAAGTDQRADRRGPQWQAAFWDLLVRAGEGRGTAKEAAGAAVRQVARPGIGS